MDSNASRKQPGAPGDCASAETSCKNCWEFNKCGREPGGARAGEKGVCPAALAEEFNGVNQGVQAGKACWAVVGTLCGGKPQRTFADKQLACLDCEFLPYLRRQMGSLFQLVPGRGRTRVG